MTCLSWSESGNQSQRSHSDVHDLASRLGWSTISNAICGCGIGKWRVPGRRCASHGDAEVEKIARPLERRGVDAQHAKATGQPNGYCQNWNLRVDFDRRLKPKFLT